jgi:hypothetical protein
MTMRRVIAILVVSYTIVVLVTLVSQLGDTGLTANEIYFIPALTGTAVGIYLTLRVPENRMGLLMTVMSLSLITLGLSNVFVPWALDQGNDLVSVAAVHVSDLAWTIQFLTALILLPLWFPTGRPINRRWAWVGRVAIIAVAIAEVSFFLSGSVCAFEDPASDACVTVPSPWGVEGFAGFEPLLLLSMLLAFPAVASAFVRWRRSDDIERHQIKWFFVAAVGLLIAVIVAFADVNQVVNEVAFASGLTGVWVAIAVAVLKYRLYEIDRIISRTISYALVVGLLGLLVAGVATVAGAQFDEPWVVAATTLAVAALFNPIRRRMQVWVDRRFNRSRYDAQRVVDEFAGSLQTRVDPGDLVEGWLGVVNSTMQPHGAAVWVRQI